MSTFHVVSQNSSFPKDYLRKPFLQPPPSLMSLMLPFLFFFTLNLIMLLFVTVITLSKFVYTTWLRIRLELLCLAETEEFRSCSA
jgi:hypothetical protein